MVMPFDDAAFTARQTEQFVASVKTVASKLRTLAEAVDRYAEDTTRVGTDRAPVMRLANNHTWTAHEVMHDVMVTLPNLALDNLVMRAYELDELRAGGRS
jgi:hypothetical protein